MTKNIQSWQKCKKKMEKTEMIKLIILLKSRNIGKDIKQKMISC